MNTIKLMKFVATIGTDNLEFIDNENCTYYISADCDWLVNNVNTTREDALYQLLHTIGAVEVQLIDGKHCKIENIFEYDELNIILNRDEQEEGDEFTQSFKLHEPE